jgi:nitrogen regulatory protein PII-like uncharacterized protein
MTAMTKDDVIKMAVKCQLINTGNREGLYMNALSEFAELVAEVEREECAKAIAAEINDEIEDEAYCILVALLARIRARGKND